MALSRKELLHAYERMTKIRAFEERLHLVSQAGEVPGFIHLYAGEEAIAVGVCEHLEPTDFIGSTHRGHGHSIAKGCDIRSMMCEIFGRQEGLCHGKGGSMHIADHSIGMLGANGIVGGTPPLAAGAALTAKTLKSHAVSVAFCGDGGTNQGTTLEALNFAVVLQLPEVFVFENNAYGEGTGVGYAVGSHDISARAAGFGLPAVKVDGADFFAVHEAAGEAVERARAGGGPSVVEAVAERWYGHYEGDPGLYRTPDHVAELRADRDPLKIFRAKVAGTIDAADLDSIDAAASEEVEAAVQYARAAAWPAIDQLTTDVYVTY
jgi:pyruvate dehydrogenase E1 component alpha subunit